MAEEEQEGGVRTADRGGGSDPRTLVRRAKEQLAEVMGRRPDAVSGFAREEDGWRVTVEVVELERIPPSTDVLATYEVQLDADGNLAGYERTRRYVRSQADEL
jgi:Gas vesicle synthesis protein GvpO